MAVGYLYVTRDTASGVAYVGQSSRMDAFSIANYMGGGDYLRRAVAEHGEMSFEKSVIGYYDNQPDLDFAEIELIAKLRAQGESLLNGGVGGPRMQQRFIRAMFERFQAVPQMTEEWLAAVSANPDVVRELLAEAATTDTDDFYREYERQLQQTQDLSRPCARCDAEIGNVCQTKTGNPAKNHAAR